MEATLVVLKHTMMCPTINERHPVATALRTTSKNLMQISRFRIVC